MGEATDLKIESSLLNGFIFNINLLLHNDILNM